MIQPTRQTAIAYANRIGTVRITAQGSAVATIDSQKYVLYQSADGWYDWIRRS